MAKRFANLNDAQVAQVRTQHERDGKAQRAVRSDLRPRIRRLLKHTAARALF